MKRSALVLVLVGASFLLISCGSQKVAETVQPVEDKTHLVQINIPTPVVTKVEEPKASVYKDVSEVRDPVIETSSVLKDDSGVGFNYEGKNIIDQDFSTAWCGTKGIGDTISFSFKDPVEAKKLGVLPGYGRDENIYFGNNRIKELKAIFTDVDGKTSEKTFNFPDKYQMDFVDLGDMKFKSVKFIVNDVYAVTNDSDTCIAELDFWSDYVKNEDAAAAMNYYTKYKEDKALRSSNTVSEVFVSDVALNQCGTPVKPSASFKDENFGISITHRDNLNASAVINQYGKVGDQLTVKWYGTYGSLGSEALNWKLIDTQKDVPVVADCNGKLYAIASSLKPELGPYRVEFFDGEKSVGSASFFLPQ